MRLTKRERILLGATMALGLAMRVAYVLATPHLKLVGDMPEYDLEGRLFAAGHLWWSSAPYGILHASAWKAPAYPAWVGLWYKLLGHHVTGLRLVQCALGPVTIGLTALLGRRLFNARVGLSAAFVVALYPLAWQFEELLYSESLATPLMLAVLLSMLTDAATSRRAALTGVLIGLSLLVRPTSIFLLGGLLVAMCVRTGLRRGLVLSGVGALAAVAVVVPWSARNLVVEKGFLPISIQDAAAYGTFNRDSANDPLLPYAWRPLPPSDAHLYDPHHPLSDLQFRSRLQTSAVQYATSHPESIALAFFWNGLSRLWDVRHKARGLFEVPFEGRSRLLTSIGLDVYRVLLPLALIALVRMRRRRELVWPVIALALGASLVFTVASGTRYRAPLEPLIVVLACSSVVAAAESLLRRGGRGVAGE